ncbi:hypothetical protein [Demequina litorisediminis]|uniref:hypothetical protein n=1 Tax=Demequina litorisediminis TaxID=1849022 RepID=UPI0024E0996F|nr:hypothetical protein [Demequina litorisediminis]
MHLHDWEFASVDGEETAFDILVEHTTRDNVVFEARPVLGGRGGCRLPVARRRAS